MLRSDLRSICLQFNSYTSNVVLHRLCTQHTIYRLIFYFHYPLPVLDSMNYAVKFRLGLILRGSSVQTTGWPRFYLWSEFFQKRHTFSESKKLIYSRPIAERVAALYVAQQIVKSSSDVHNAIPMSNFISGMPGLTRDAVFQENLDVSDWVKNTALLEVVYLQEDREVLTHHDHCMKWSSEGCNAAEPYRRYGAMEYIKVKLDVNEVLRICTEDSNDEEKAPEAEHTEHDEELKALAKVLEAHESKRTSRWFMFNEAVLLAKREAQKYSGNHPLRYFIHAEPTNIKKLLRTQEAKTFLWVSEEYMVAFRRPEEQLSPVVSLPEQPRTRRALSLNNFGGWGSQACVPTKEDVYEILRYVPLNWGNFGSLNIPPQVKKKHIRCAATMQWFRRQPHYFELRNMNGTIEIRRSPALHPEHHGMTADQAKAWVEQGISTGTINNLVLLGPDGQPLQQLSPTEKHLQKFFYRVCPPYFVPFSLILQRCTKKNVTTHDLQDVAMEHPEDFEIVSAVGMQHSFVRKRAGADSARWKKAFIDDLTSRPDDIPGIGVICNHVCATWDRAEYVYVLLSDEEKNVVGEFDQMVQIIRRHPELFRVGEKFFCRVDSSDPSFKELPEPVETEMTSRTHLRDENPYLSTKEIAKVFHYVASSDEPCTASFFVRCSSPAMRVALPTRITTILQEFPRLFVCKETSPGVFSVRKITTGSAKTRIKGIPPSSSEEDTSWITEDTSDASDSSSRTDVIDAVKQLIPPDGVEYDRLLLWASLQVQRAINSHYGSLMKMIESEKKHFKVTKTEKSTLVKIAGE